MVSINTNLQSLIVQNNLAKSTNALNLAIERMTTGFKLNHSKDNAAGYSIAQNMTSKLSSYDIAADNISAGMDLIATAQDTIALMQSHGERIHSLITQAQNGTYGAQSLEAIQSEVNARLDEIARLHSTTEYNDINIFGENASSSFISNAVDYTKQEIDEMDSVAETDTFVANQTYSITTVDELKKLGTISANGAIFVLGADLDLNSEAWTPINFSNGTINGNGHIIKNLYVTYNQYVSELRSNRGLFGTVTSSTIKNLGIEDASVTGAQNVGILSGYSNGTAINNCYATGTVTMGYATTRENIGGLVGKTNQSTAIIENCYTDVSVNAQHSNGNGKYCGGIVGYTKAKVKNCYSIGDVAGGSYSGGISGISVTTHIMNCYSMGDVTGDNYSGGITGECYSVSNSYSTGDVTGIDHVGGVAGGTYFGGYIQDSYSTGNIKGTSDVQQIVGTNNSTAVTNSEGSGTVTQNNVDITASTQNHVDSISESLKAIAGVSTSSTPSEGSDEVSTEIVLQVGINGDTSSSITFDSGLSYDLSSLRSGIQNASSFDVINAFLNQLSSKATELGAVSNRLESALESTTTAMNNLTSSVSTIRDADIAKESSAYIKSQILQQASATLLATANQTPSIALQLL